MSDRILGAVGVVLGLFYIWASTRIELSFMSDPVGPRTFPIIIGAILVLTSLIIMLKPDIGPHWPGRGRILDIGAAVLAMFLYAWLLPTLGFITDTVFATAYLSWRLGATPLQASLGGVLTSLGIYAVFHLILGLSLARGPLGF